MSYLRNDQRYADAFLRVQEEDFPIHRSVLGSQNNYFDGLFLDVLGRERFPDNQLMKNGKPVYDLSNVVKYHATMKLTLDIFYDGVHDIDLDEIRLKLKGIPSVEKYNIYLDIARFHDFINFDRFITMNFFLTEVEKCLTRQDMADKAEQLTTELVQLPFISDNLKKRVVANFVNKPWCQGEVFDKYRPKKEDKPIRRWVELKKLPCADANGKPVTVYVTLDENKFIVRPNYKAHPVTTYPVIGVLTDDGRQRPLTPEEKETALFMGFTLIN